MKWRGFIDRIGEWRQLLQPEKVITYDDYKKLSKEKYNELLEKYNKLKKRRRKK